MTTWKSILLLAPVAAVAGIAVGYAFSIFPAAHVGEQLTAVAAVVGGLIGAGGAALAVYLTLGAQRRDDASKVEDSLGAPLSPAHTWTVEAHPDEVANGTLDEPARDDEPLFA